jgi:hypothetical protein
MSSRLKKSVFIFLPLFIIACGVIFIQNRNAPFDYVVRAHEIRADVAAKLTERYNMGIIGISGGMIDKVNVIGLSFQILGPLSKEKLREILVDCVEEFLTSINEDEEIRPFLKNFPFTEQEIVINIFIVDKAGRNVYDPDIMVATANKGKMTYRTKDKNVEIGYKNEMKEDFQTALKSVRERS